MIVRFRHHPWLSAVLLALVVATVRAQSPSPDSTVVEIVPVGCTTCSEGLLGGLKAPSLEGDGCGCAGGQCYPGRTPCYPCEHHSLVGRFLCGIYECICCPDPCYEGKWTPLQDSAFFVESARPVTTSRFRWDSGQNLIFPDRSEYFWARADGKGKGPRPPGSMQQGQMTTGTMGTTTTSKMTSQTNSRFVGERGLRYNDFVMINEGGTGVITLLVETPYRSLQPEILPHASGFTDINIGTKTLLFDCELLQISFLFKTYIPSGSFLKGLGTGHVSLEPSLLFGVKISPTTYFQLQVSEWIPVGGDPGYAGSIFHTHSSLNQVLCKLLPDVPVIGTWELNTWAFQDGAYTDPVLGSFQKSSGTVYSSMGVGVRLFGCDKIDFGIGMSFALTEQHFADQLYRTEFRVRY